MNLGQEVRKLKGFGKSSPPQEKNCSVLATENPTFFHDLAPLGSTRICCAFC